MSDTIFCPDDFVFGLDIGTRNVVGTVGYMKNGRFQAAAIVSKEHETRAMLDGQIHDIGKVGDTIRMIKHELESMTGKKLKEVCIAAAGVSVIGELAELTRHSDKLLSSIPFLLIEVIMGAAALALLKNAKKYMWKRV